MQDQNIQQNGTPNNYFTSAMTFFRNLLVDEKKEITLALVYQKNDKAKKLIIDYAKTHTKEENLTFFNSLNHFDHTLLDQSISSQCYDSSALLLEFGVNPNKCLKNGKWEKYDHIERSIIGNNPSVYRLLSLYDVSIEGIKPCFSDKTNNKAMRARINSVKNDLIPRGHRRMELMREAEKAEREYRYQDAAKAYQEIAGIWRVSYQEEDNKLLKDFYHEQNSTFLKKVVESNQTYKSGEKENSPIATLHHRKKMDEQTLLPLTTNPNFSKSQ